MATGPNRLALALVFACLGAAAFGAANAQAGVITDDGTTLRYLPVDEFGGQSSTVIVERFSGDGFKDIQIFDSAGLGGPDPPGCIRLTPYQIRCPERPNVEVNLGLGQDRFVLSSQFAPWGNEINLKVLGAPGTDVLRLGPAGGRNFLTAPAMEAAAEPLGTLDGGPGNDQLFGGPFADRLIGGPGNDRMFGGPGVDLFSGGPGRDFARGGGGNDRGSGGPGDDNFRD